MDTNLDARAVEAVKNGDRQRYAELVDRYERKVYAVAWCRLGDADLAEEATQEAFIKAYRHLGSLSQADRFAEWVTAIARNAAISLGLRRRSDLKNRERWALAKIEETQTPARPTAQEEPVPVDALRQALASLPARHRECLALFYLEGKGVTEAARTLGLSESAFKTRLHRARLALRERLEERLEGSLGQLRPRHATAPAVMAALAAQNTKAMAAGGIGVLAKVAGAIAKWLPLQFTIVGLWLVALIPNLALQAWLGRLELRNFRNPDGFRARLLKRRLSRMWIGLPVLMTTVFIVTIIAVVLVGIRAMMAVSSIWVVVVVIEQTRRVILTRCRYDVYQLLGLVVLALFLAGRAFPDFCPLATELLEGLVFLFLGLSIRHMPRRMDYSLFLRAVQGLIPECPASPTGRALTAKEVFAFGRFLAERRLVEDWRRAKGGMQFRLAPVYRAVWKDGFSPFIWHGNSLLTIRFDGTLSATVSERDLASLGRTQGKSIPFRFEERVACAASRAAAAVLAGDIHEAEHALGQQPDAEIFRRAPEHSAASRWQMALMIALGVLMIGLAVYGFCLDTYNLPTHGVHLKTVQLTEAEVRAGLSRVSHADREAWQAFDFFLEYGGLSFPPQDLFTADAWEAVRQHVWTKVRRHGIKTNDDPGSLIEVLFQFQDFQRALLAGIITVPELAGKGATMDAARDYLKGPPAPGLSHVTWPEVVQVQGQGYTILETKGFSTGLRVMALLHCLDAVDTNSVIALISGHQVVAGNSLAGRKPIPETKVVHGLFHCYGSQPLKDTYHCLTILSLLGGLDRIDREACVQGILRFHHGKGLFGSFTKNDGLYFEGGSHDTFYGYESLRVLNALDRVKDLDRWVFRPLPGRAANQPSPAATWPAIEAWVYQQRLNQFIEARKKNPRLVPPSLAPLP